MYVWRSVRPLLSEGASTQCMHVHLSEGRYFRWQIFLVRYHDAELSVSLDESISKWQAIGGAYLLASSLLSCGFKNKGLHDRPAATVSMGSKHWKMVARISIYHFTLT